jgi:hypothetical protein
MVLMCMAGLCWTACGHLGMASAGKGLCMLTQWLQLGYADGSEASRSSRQGTASPWVPQAVLHGLMRALGDGHDASSIPRLAASFLMCSALSAFSYWPSDCQVYVHVNSI